MDTLALALDVHGKLSQLVAPASPDSIQASSFFKNKTLLTIVVAGVFSVLVLLLSALLPAILADANAAGSANTKAVFDLLQILGAAGFGASFYSLYTATTYLRDGTFDPRYNQVYLIRFILGVFAGVILAQFAEQLLNLQQYKIGVTALALVGGYSAEAVAQMLQRVADTLLTLVRGNSEDRAAAVAEKDKAQAAAKISSLLQEALTAQGDDQQKKIREAIAQLLK